MPTCVIDHLDCVPELNLFILIRFLIHDFLMLRHLVLGLFKLLFLIETNFSSSTCSFSFLFLCYGKMHQLPHGIAIAIAIALLSKRGEKVGYPFNSWDNTIFFKIDLCLIIRCWYFWLLKCSFIVLGRLIAHGNVIKDLTSPVKNPLIFSWNDQNPDAF